MKKVLCIIFLVFFAILTDDQVIGLPWWKRQSDERQNSTGQAFMFTRPIYQNIAAQQSQFWHDAVYNKQSCHLTSIQALPLFAHSFNTSSPAQYFLINHKETLIFKGDNVPPFNSNDRDVRAEWLRLPSNFVGTLSVAPKQKQFGLWFELNHDLKKYIEHEYFNTLWVAAAIPLQIVANNLQPTPCIIATTDTQTPSTILQAFNDSHLDFGKIIPGKQQNFSVAEVYLKLGSTFYNCDGFQLGIYGGTIFPMFGHQTQNLCLVPCLGIIGTLAFYAAEMHNYHSMQTPTIILLPLFLASKANIFCVTSSTARLIYVLSPGAAICN
jgi:hypothetical protein